MGKRGPIFFGMLLSLSFFSGLLTLLVLSGTTTPIPPASELPRLLPPDSRAPDVLGAPLGRDALQVPFPTFDDGVLLAPLGSSPSTLPGAGLVGGLRRARPVDGDGPPSVVLQPPGVLPPQDRDDDDEAPDRHRRVRGKGHEKRHGKGHEQVAGADLEGQGAGASSLGGRGDEPKASEGRSGGPRPRKARKTAKR